MGAEHRRRRIPIRSAERETWDDDGSTAAVAGSPDGPDHGEDALLPEVVVEALVETAWSFPGMRVSCGRLMPDHRIHVQASAGANQSREMAGEWLPLGDAPEVLRVLSRGESVRVEDTKADSRLVGLGPELLSRSARSLFMLPILGTRGDRPLLGVVLFDAPHARTWSTREQAALERVAPIVGLALENVALEEALAQRDAKAATDDRRTDALRGLVGSATHDARELLDAVLELARAPERQGHADSLRGLEAELHGALEELAALPSGFGSSRGRLEIDLNEFIVAAAPVLRALLGPAYRLFVRTDARPVSIQGSRRGLERMVRNLVAAAAEAGTGRDLVLGASSTAHAARLEFSGNAVGIDHRVSNLLGNGDLNIDRLGVDLWQVRCEALFHGAELSHTAGGDGPTIVVEFATPTNA